MKIVHVITRFNVGGTATWLTHLSDSTINAGHESFLLAGNVLNDEFEDSNFLEINGIRIRKLQQSMSPIGAFLAFTQIRRCIKKLRPDLVNTHTSFAGLVGRLAAASLMRNRPAIIHTVHGHVLNGYFGPIKKIIIVSVEKLLFRLTDLTLFSGKEVRRSFTFEVKIPEDKTALVSPGVPPSFSKIKQKVGKKTFTVGWLGRFAPIKNPDLAIEVAQLLPDIEFLFGGDGMLLDSCKRKATPNCTFVGWTSAKDFWEMCDIALLTSKNEAQPISIIEAGLRGKPAVITPAGSAPEVVIHGQTGLVSQFDAVKIKEAILKLKRSVALRKSMGHSAVEIYAREYSLDKQLSDHLSAYEKALEIRYRKKVYNP
jgi:glycosyltransferase involved in cell wall biosynthesis